MKKSKLKKKVAKKTKKTTTPKTPAKRKQFNRELPEEEMTTNTTKYEIRKGIPLPWGRIRRGEIEFPFQLMKVGDSFSYQKKDKGAGRVYSAANGYCKQEENFHKKFVVRKIKEEFDRGALVYTYGCWRISDLTEEEIAEKKIHFGIQSVS